MKIGTCHLCMSAVPFQSSRGRTFYVHFAKIKIVVTHKSLCCFVHFISDKNNLKYVKVQPLEVVQKQPGQSHKQFEKSLKTSELDWIKKLQTAYPLGLNDNITGKGNISRTSSINIMDIVDRRKRNLRSPEEANKS